MNAAKFLSMHLQKGDFVDASWTISPARLEERAFALQVACAHLPVDEQPAFIAQMQDLIALGEIDPQGLFVARHHHNLRGVFACLPMPGATALVWPPRGEIFVPACLEPGGDEPIGGRRVGSPSAADRLIAAGLEWLRERGVKVAQAIVAPEDADALTPLAAHGSVPVGPMFFFRHDLAVMPQAPTNPELRLVPVAQIDPEVFARTLVLTYQDTFDFPELSNIRTVDEILASYRANPIYRPDHWRIAFQQDEPAGVLMLSELNALDAWDLTYLGVVPQQRRKGVGQALLEAALHIVEDAAGAHLEVAVDARNAPAIQLYARLGFQLMGERRLCLIFLRPPA